MAYTPPGVRVQRRSVVTATNDQEAELVSCIIGPLYHVVERGVAAASFNALDIAAQAFEWPDHKIGTVVDLGGTRAGYVDSQRKEFFASCPTFLLRDPATEQVYTIADQYVQTITQDGFELLQGARGSNQRATLNIWAVELDNGIVFYRPPQSGTTGFTLTRLGDLFTAGGEDFVVSSRTDVLLTPDTEPSAPSTDVRLETDGTQTVNVTLAASAGRVVVALGASDFPTEAATFGVGDPVVLYAPRAGFASVAGALTTNLDEADGLVLSVSFAAEDVVGRWAKVVNTTQSTTIWAKVTAFNPGAQTMEFDANVGTTNNDVLAITLYDSVLGYAESFNGANTQVTVVVSRTFAATGSAIVLYPTAYSNVAFWPPFEVLASYRELRKDLANQVLDARRSDDLLTLLEHDASVPADRLAYHVTAALSTQTGDRSVYFIPVDIEPDGETGLPENYDLELGYEEALISAESVDVFSVVCLDIDIPAVADLYEQHILLMNSDEEQMERRGYLYTKVPKGDVESQSGVIEPGRTISGTAASVASGNLFIKDAAVEFVTAAGVVAGTKVVVVAPLELAGEYTASADTTDELLVLAGGGVWPYTAYGSRTTVGLTLSTTGGVHTLSGASAGHWRDVEAGDYLHITINAVIYRLRVTGVTADGTTLTLVDEAPGDLSFTGQPLTGNAFVIRSWGGEGNSPFVEYYIRPLTRTQQVSKLITNKTVQSEHLSYTLDYAATKQTGINQSNQPVYEELEPTVTLAAISGRRSGVNSNQEITNLTLGFGIESVRYGFNFFRRTQLNQLAENGFLLMEQAAQSGAAPIIRDMLTSRTGGLEVTQEMVVANSAWQAKTLRARFTRPDGELMPNNSEALRGLRRLQLEATLTEWRDQGRLVDYEDVAVEADANDETQNNLQYLGYFPVGEKRVKILMQIAV